MDESDSDAAAHFRRPAFAPSIRVSSDTEGSLGDSNEPSTSAGLKGGRRRKMSWIVQPHEPAIYDVASGTYTGPSPPHSRSTQSSGSARSTSIGRHEESTTTTTTDAAPLLEKTMPVLVDYLENIDSLGSGGFHLGEKTKTRQTNSTRSFSQVRTFSV